MDIFSIGASIMGVLFLVVVAYLMYKTEVTDEED